MFYMLVFHVKAFPKRESVKDLTILVASWFLRYSD